MEHIAIALGVLQLATALFMRYAGRRLVPQPFGKEPKGIAHHPIVARLLLWSSLLLFITLIATSFLVPQLGWWFFGGSCALFLFFSPPLRNLL
ncbi:hypothetical protein [Desulfurispira natronophila]|uniref:Uncharacterized protein n=1 Tax=Desulfurispira natronophila TaxID=682562 RepID=A0A7W7Y5Z0_9BACT|nr:hypothetical protein [Desulfurispira natronophila]MBB5022673.1 hypothetical protein [Desulfurispira natronophila]